MRIIAGEFGGRLIAAPPGEGTRPMLDRVREALFSKLAERFEGARVLDLFAGSGSLGLEAASRGASLSRMVERDRGALRVLRANVESLGLNERVEVFAGDALGGAAWANAHWDVVFFDPPYPLLEAPKTRLLVLGGLEKLLSAHVATEGVLVYHAARGSIGEPQLARMAEVELREYGTNALWYLTPREAAQ